MGLPLGILDNPMGIAPTHLSLIYAILNYIAAATLVRTFLVPREAGDQKRPCPNQSVYGYINGKARPKGSCFSCI